MKATEYDPWPALMAFCRRAGARCFGAFPDSTLSDYLRLHLRQNTLRWVRHPEGAIAGLATGWRATAAQVQAAVTAGRWGAMPDNPRGDRAVIGDVIAPTPAARRALWASFAVRYPNWWALPIVTFRHGRCVTIRRVCLERLLKGM